MGLLMSLISVTLKAEQGISGIGLYMFGLGLSSLLFKSTSARSRPCGLSAGQDPAAGRYPGRSGPILFRNSMLVYGAFLLVPLAWWLLEKTTWG